MTTNSTLRHYFPILTRGAEYSSKTFDAFPAASIPGKPAGKGDMRAAE